MSSINATLGFLSTKISATMYKHLICLSDTRILLQAYFVLTFKLYIIFHDLALSLFFCLIYFLFVSPQFLHFVYAHIPLRRSPPLAGDQRFSYITRLFFKDIIWTTTYILLSFLYKWLILTNNLSRITSTDFYRWIIEASLTPYLLLLTIIDCYIGYLGLTVFDQRQTCFVAAVSCKIPIFFLMRYGESKRDSGVNQLLHVSRIRICNRLIE